MQTQSSNIWRWSTLDTAVPTLAWLLAVWIQHSGAASHLFTERLSLKNCVLLIVFLILWTGIHQLYGLYTKTRRLSFRSLLLRTVLASALGSIFFLLFPLFSHAHSTSIVLPAVIFFAAAVSGSLLIRSVLWRFLPGIGGPDRPVRTLIIGSGPIALRLLESLQSDVNPRHEILGFVDSPLDRSTSGKIAPLLLGDFDELDHLLMTTAVDEVAIALPMRSCYDQIQAAIQICERSGIAVNYCFEPFAHTLGFSQLQERAPQPCISWRPSRVEQLIAPKRVLDILCAAAGLIVLSPLLGAIAIAVKLSGPGPLFFLGERYGLHKQRFRMYKFRTMVADAEARQAALESRNEAQGPVFKIKHDPRVTRLGNFLRKTSLDELPQLINVLRGEMSLVGPRPLPTRDVARFNDSWLMRRFSVKPGLTCLWQIRGRSNTDFEQWIAYDLEYIDTWSPMLDARILLQTIPAVVWGRGAM